MANDMIRLCQNVRLEGEESRCNGKAILCFEKTVEQSTKVCAEMPSTVEVRAALDDLIKGICDSSGLKKCHAERIGEPVEEKTGGWLKKIWQTITDWSVSQRTKAARGEMPEYPTRPATPRY